MPLLMIGYAQEKNHYSGCIHGVNLQWTWYDNYLRSSKSYQVSFNRIKKFGCQKPTKYGRFIFYEAVKNDTANSKKTSFNNTISSTLSLITVFLEIHLKPSTYKRYYVVKRRTLNRPSHHWIKPIHVMVMTLTLTMMSTIQSKKNCWWCLRVFASLFCRNSFKTSFVFWWK